MFRSRNWVGCVVFITGSSKAWENDVTEEARVTQMEVGDTVTFLASEAASYSSGQNICVNGSHTVA